MSKPMYYECEVAIEPLEVGDHRRALLAQLCDRLSFRAAELIGRSRPSTILTCEDEKEQRIRERLVEISRELRTLGVRARKAKIESVLYEVSDVSQIEEAS